MIHHDCKQGSPEWLAARLGIPTSSEFGRLVTPTGKPSKQMEGYCNECVAEAVSGDATPRFAKSFWMERGIELEEEAAAWYAAITDREVRVCGLFTDDLNQRGASPDRIVGYEEPVGLLEIKCPAPWTHIEYLLDGGIPLCYHPQVQGQMLVTGLPWVDWISYHPKYGGHIVRAEPDAEYQAKLLAALEAFHRMKIEKIDNLSQMGIG